MENSLDQPQESPPDGDGPQGLFIMELNSENWTKITDHLASLNVTAIARDSYHYYVGTDRGISVIPLQDIEGKK